MDPSSFGSPGPFSPVKLTNIVTAHLVSSYAYIEEDFFFRGVDCMVGWCWKTSGGCGEREREREGTICRGLGPRGGGLERSLPKKFLSLRF